MMVFDNFIKIQVILEIGDTALPALDVAIDSSMDEMDAGLN